MTGSPEDIAWAGGVLSGAGVFYHHQGTVAFILPAKDPEIIERFNRVTGVGVMQSFARHDHAEFYWIAAHVYQVQYVANILSEYLTSSQRRKCIQMCGVPEVAGRKFKVICGKGHIRLPENLTSKNQCKKCIAMRRHEEFYRDKNAGG